MQPVFEHFSQKGTHSVTQPSASLDIAVFLANFTCFSHLERMQNQSSLIVLQRFEDNSYIQPPILLYLLPISNLETPSTHCLPLCSPHMWWRIFFIACHSVTINCLRHLTVISKHYSQLITTGDNTCHALGNKCLLVNFKDSLL